MSDNDLFYHMSMIMNVDQAEIAKIIHDYIERDTGNGYDRFNSPPPPIYIGPVKVKSLKERLEETKMKATSTETFKDIIAIDLELQTFPNPDVQDKFIVSATNRDDIFCFVFEGPHIEDACRKAGLFTGWEKDQKIRELEEELGRWKKEAADCLRLRDEAQKEAYKLKKEKEKYEEKIKKLEHDDMLDKNAADYWSKEHDILLERFAKLQVENKKLKDKLENVEPFRSLERTIKEKQRLKEEYEEKIVDLQRKYNLEREANEAQHKFIKEYAGNDTEVTFNYAIGSGPITYGLYDKDYIDKLRKEIHDLIAENTELKTKLHDTAKEGDYVYLGSIPYSADDIKKLKEQIKKLEQLKTPTIENFADEEPSDNVNHPSHYTGRYECIDVMQDVFGNEATDNFCLCNAFKYIWRARKKNGLEDVKKAVWYLNKYIEEAEKDGVRKGEQV